jgi:hypothetical protein
MTQIRMRGDGYYSAHSPGQRLIIAKILAALNALDPALCGTVFAIADCALKETASR